MIRQRIVDLFLQHGAPVPLDRIAVELGLSDNDFELELKRTGKLNELGALQIGQANELIHFYGRDFLFTTNVVEKVAQYHAVRQKLDETERKARKKRDPSSDS